MKVAWITGLVLPPKLPGTRRNLSVRMIPPLQTGVVPAVERGAAGMGSGHKNQGGQGTGLALSCSLGLKHN